MLNLNKARMKSSPHGSNTHDVVGNRTTGGPTRMVYVWDEFNRLEYTQDQYSEMSYDYLPGGLRSTKITDSSNASLKGPDMSGFYDEDVFKNLPTNRYRYDGPMTLEEDYSYILDEEPYVDETRYTLGVRGIESIEAERVDGQSTTGVTLNQKYRSFPIYDGHGNMICTLERDGTDFVLKNEKRYDVWGGVRSYSNDGAVLNPNKQYCANLGHTRDEETGLIYMRARYYEPWTGRFISEDPARDGMNWYGYVGNNPVSKTDFTGKWAHVLIGAVFGFIMGAVVAHSTGSMHWLAGGLIGFASAAAGSLLANPAAAGAVSGFLGSIASSLASGERDPSKIMKSAVLAAFIGAGTGGIASWAAKKMMTSFTNPTKLFAGDDVAGAFDDSVQNAESAIGAGMGTASEGIMQMLN